MPVTKMYVTREPAIVPISSLSPVLEEVVAITLPDTAVNADAIAIGAGRPQWSQYEMTAQNAGALHVDLALLLGERHDGSVVEAPVADPSDRGFTGAAIRVEGLWHDEPVLHLDARLADTAAVAPNQVSAAPTMIVSAIDAAPVIAVAVEAHVFAAVDLTAFIDVNGAHPALHEAFAVPHHDILPIDDTVPLFG